MMRSFRLSIAATAVALAVHGADASAQFSNAFAVGDSLSDAGQYGARFTTNPGLAVPQYLAQRYGLALTPSFTGGNDFAQGGAIVNGPSPLVPPGIPNLSITEQVSQLLGRGPLDSSALYQFWAGSNDILVIADAAAAGQLTPAQVQAAVVQAASGAVAQLARLRAAGAQYLIVYNVPDIGRTPFAASQNAQATFTSLSSLFDTTLNAGIGATGLQVVHVNVFALLNEAIANPAAFGFVNVTIPACTTETALTCTPATLRDPSAALTFLFADGVHPTTRAAQIVAQAAASMIEGPSKIGVLAEAPLAVEQATFRAIDSRMISALDAPAARERFTAWASYDYGHNDFDGRFVSGDANLNTVSAGGDMKITDRLLAGVAFGYSEDKGDFGAGSGGYKLHETTGTAYVGYGGGPWYVGATLGAGDLDYRDIHRTFDLGELRRTEHGDTNGWQVMGSVLGGYWFSYADWLHGPFVRLAWQDIRVKGFSEQGSDSTALSYGEQRRKSFLSTLGWQLSGQIGNVRPFARLAWEFEGKNDDRFVSATPVGLNGTYAVPTIKPDDNYFAYLIGVSADFGRVTGYLVGSGSAGRSDGNGYGITVGVRVPL
jgi:outer membrane lipase/esterase